MLKLNVATRSEKNKDRFFFKNALWSNKHLKYYFDLQEKVDQVTFDKTYSIYKQKFRFPQIKVYVNILLFTNKNIMVRKNSHEYEKREFNLSIHT